MGNLIAYYASQSDYDNEIEIATMSNHIIEQINGITQWKIISADNEAPYDPNIIYNVGDELALAPEATLYKYYLIPAIICFKEGSKILCLVNEVETYVPVEKLYHNILVKTYKHGFKKLVLIGKHTIYNNPFDNETLYKLTPQNYPILTENLYITGKHALLVDTLTDKQRLDTINTLKKIYITDDKYRLCICNDEKAEKLNDLEYFNIYHFALENNDPKLNYGVYVNGGLLVETCSIYRLQNKSNLSLY